MKIGDKYLAILCILAFIALCLVPAHCQVAVTLAPVPKLQFMDANGKPLSGGCVFTYAAGTTNQQATYTSSSGTVQNANPVILDSAGRASIWVTSQSYKFAVWAAGGINCSSGVQQYSIDNISAPILSSVSSITSASANAASAGWLMLANGDLINWRNFANSANIGFSQAGAAATGNGNLADVLRYGDSSHGAVQAQAFLDFSAGPAQSGVIRTGNNVCAFASRNAAGNGDVCGAQINSNNSLVLSGATQINGAGNLPAATNSGLWMTGAGGPNIGFIFIGDGTGNDIQFVKRTGSVTTPLFTFADNGVMTLGSVTFSNLPASSNGSVIYCSDCNSTCTGGSSAGRTCFRENGAWTH